MLLASLAKKHLPFASSVSLTRAYPSSTPTQTFLFLLYRYIHEYVSLQ